jgi:uncharacterized protein YcbK (DUF882 family)
MGSYFTTDEFKCPCDCGFGTKEHHIDKKLIEMLNLLRITYGQPLVVTSGARCEEYNRSIGGVVDSAHTPHHTLKTCRAADILVRSGLERHFLVKYALEIGFQRIGNALNFVHLDTARDLPSPTMFTY